MSETIVKAAETREVPLDVSAVGSRTGRASVRASLERLGYAPAEEARFWTRAFRRDDPRPGQSMLVIGDLYQIARRYQAHSHHEWTLAVRKSRPFFLAFVRTRRDEACAWLVGDLVRRSELRVSLCRGAPSSPEARECLAAAIAALEPDTLVDLRLSPDGDRLRVEFADGAAGELRWQQLGVDEAQRGRLVLESAIVGTRGQAVEVLATDGGLFEIDAAAIRALLDPESAADLRELTDRSDAAVGAQIRAARARAGLTQTDLAGRIGIDQAVISRLERGVHRPRLDTLARVAEGLGLNVPALLSS